MDMSNPIRSTLSRQDAMTLRDTLQTTPETAELSVRLDDVGSDTDQVWLTIRATKDQKGPALNAAWEVAKRTLGENTPKSVIGCIIEKADANRSR